MIGTVLQTNQLISLSMYHAHLQKNMTGLQIFIIATEFLPSLYCYFFNTIIFLHFTPPFEFYVMFGKSENTLEYMFIQMLQSCNEFNDWKCYILLHEHDVASNDCTSYSQKWRLFIAKSGFSFYMPHNVYPNYL